MEAHLLIQELSPTPLTEQGKEGEEEAGKGRWPEVPIKLVHSPADWQAQEDTDRQILCSSGGHCGLWGAGGGAGERLLCDIETKVCGGSSGGLCSYAWVPTVLCLPTLPYPHHYRHDINVNGC